jgi:hypothetical protein
MNNQPEQKQDKAYAIRKIAVVFLISVVMLVLLAAPVSAGTCYLFAAGTANKTLCIDPNIIDYTNLSLLIGNMAGIFPGIVTLVVGVLPILITLAIIGVIFGILGAVVGMIGSLAHGLLK